MSILYENFIEDSLDSATLVSLLRERVRANPDKIGYTFLSDGEGKEQNLSYHHLDEQARAIAVLLQSLGLTGERVLLCYSAGLEYIAAFFGCLYAGTIAVPAYPPRLNRSLLRLQTIADSAQAQAVLTTTPILARIESLFTQAPALKHLQWLASDNVARELAEQWQPPILNSQALAYLQYTSGSTSAPKGVMISHHNVLHNCAYIDYGFEHSVDSRSLTWLPHFHDMGLVDGILQPLYKGFHGFLMSPTAFLQRPLGWLQAISHYRITHSGGPNFAYELCLRKIDPSDCTALDLSSWQVAYNGAEPIRKEVIEAFTTTFARYGFRRRTFYPAYGLAEATLKVSGGWKKHEPIYCSVQSIALEQHRVVQSSQYEDNTHTLVSSGHTALGTEVVIVNPESLTKCLPDEVGEIWVAGPGVAQGYWNQPIETTATFQAYLTDTDEGPFLRTGDLGFLKDGELFVTGRLKDLIIIRGRNHYPQDIEYTVEQCHSSLRRGSGAAFSIEVDGQERLVIVQEVERRQRAQLDEIIDAIRRTLAEIHEVQVYAVILIKTGSIPKTSSGKIQRSECRKQFLAHSFDVVGEYWQTISTDLSDDISTVVLADIAAIEEWLSLLIAAKIGIASERIETNRPIVEYGLDSLMAIELVHEIEIRLGVVLPMANLLQNPTISELAAQTHTQLRANKPDIRKPDRESEKAASEYRLSHGQQALWFLYKIAPESTAYNIVNLLRIRGDLNIAALQRTFQQLVDRHACLRTTFTSIDGEPRQNIQETIEVCFQVRDASNWDESLLNQQLVEEVHQPFDLEQGPLLKLSLLVRSKQEHILLLRVHHIVADFWSLSVLMHELGIIYVAEKQGDANVTLPTLSLQYTDYVRRQEDMLAGVEGERLWQYWQQQLAGELPILNLFTDHPRPSVQTYHGASYPS
ncbi:MAG: AMP-binding protein, partial [Acidobacteriota bacterium]